MGGGFDINRDVGTDNRSELKSAGSGRIAADCGGDLAKDSGVDLNTEAGDVSDRYTYGDYLESGEIGNTFGGNSEIDLNDYNSGYTNEEVRNSLDSSEGEGAYKYSKDAGFEQLDSALDGFQEDKWNDLSLDEQKQSMTSLADYVADTTGNKNPPEIVFRDDMGDGEYGGYSPATNTLEINENMLNDSSEAADTVAHEMWHAYQHQCSLDPSSEKGREYQEGFDNYISPEYDFEGYENQMVEVEAREFAQGFKDKLAGLKGAV